MAGRRRLFSAPPPPRGGRSEARRQSGLSDLTDIAAVLVRETERAFLISDGVTEAWVPKAEVEHDGAGIFTMPEWLAKDRGLI